MENHVMCKELNSAPPIWQVETALTRQSALLALTRPLQSHASRWCRAGRRGKKVAEHVGEVSQTCYS